MPDNSRGVHPLIIGFLGAGAVLAAALLAVSTAATPAASALASPAADAAFQKFWAARNTGDAAKAVDDVVKSGPAFGDAADRLADTQTAIPQHAQEGGQRFLLPIGEQ